MSCEWSRQLSLGWCLQAAALRLAFSDYLDLSLEERVSILRGLADMVLGQEVVADWVWRCIEGMGPPKRKQVS